MRRRFVVLSELSQQLLDGHDVDVADVCDPLTSHVAPSSSQNLSMSKKTPAKPT